MFCLTIRFQSCPLVAKSQDFVSNVRFQSSFVADRKILTDTSVLSGGLCYTKFCLIRQFSAMACGTSLGSIRHVRSQRWLPKGGRGCYVPPTPPPLSGISGLSFDSTLLSTLLFFCLILLLFLSYLFFLPAGPFS